MKKNPRSKNSTLIACGIGEDVGDPLPVARVPFFGLESRLIVAEPFHKKPGLLLREPKDRLVTYLRRFTHDDYLITTPCFVLFQRTAKDINRFLLLASEMFLQNRVRLSV